MTVLTQQDWEQRAQALTIEARAFIDGRYRDALGGATFDDLSPVDGRQLARVASCMAKDAGLAVRAARASFARGDWAHRAPAQRKRVLILRAGSVWINQYDGGDMTAPFGGFKQSGNGRDKSLHAFAKYTELKATWIKL